MWWAALALAVGPAVPPTAWEFSDDEARSLYNEGVRQLDAADPATAEKSFREAVAKEPIAGSGWFGVALALVNQNRATEALPILQTVSVHHPRTEVMVELSRAAFAQQDFEAAADAAFGPVMHEPGNVRVQDAYQWALLRLGRYEDALAALAEARSLASTPVWDCLEIRIHADRGDLSRANALLDSCRDATETDLVRSAEALVDATLGSARDPFGERTASAWRLADEGRIGDALSIATELVHERPDDVTALLLRGTLLVKAGDHGAAKADLTHALSGSAWVEVERTGAVSGIVTKGAEEKLRGQIQRGAAVLVLLHAETGTLGEGREVADRAAAQFGSYPALEAATARLQLAEGDRGSAWARVREAMGASRDRGFVLEIAARMAYADPTGAPSDVVAELRAHADWRLHYNLAAGLANAGADGACLEAVSFGLQSVDADGAGAVELRTVGYGCAINARDLDRAGAYADQLGEAAPPAYRLQHANLAAAQGSYAVALARLDAAPFPAELAAAERALRLLCYTQLDELDRALAHVSDDAEPSVTLRLGVKLAVAKRTTEAAALLEHTCPRLQGESARVCGEVLAELIADR